MVHNHKIKIISSGTQLQLLNKVLDQSKVLLEMYLPSLDIYFFRQIATFIKVHMAFAFGPQTL